MGEATHKAVFLSYASQDAEAARRICDALRAAGVEVWFDQSELRGGDAWDAKIRKQIKECALFVPVISANTQARREGYFRIEWKLAAQRTHAIAEGTPFLLPVVLDGAPEPDALVPAEFREVQWTRWPERGATGGLCGQVTRLLEGSDGNAGPAPPRGEAPLASPRILRHRRSPRWPLVVAAAAGGAALLTAFVWQPWRAGAHVQPESVPSLSIRAAPQVAPPSTQVEKLLVQIWTIYDKQTDATPEERALAGELGAQVAKLEPANAEAWAAYSVSTWANWFYTGSAKQGQVPALRQAERAFTLDKHSRSARLALANVQRHSPPTVAIAEQTLRQLVEENASDQRALRLLAYVLRNRGTNEREHAEALFQEALGFLDRAAALPGGDPSALLGKANLLAALGRYREARAAAAEAVRLRNGPNAFSIHVNLMFQLDGDLEGAVAALDRAPAEFWAKEPSIAFATWLALCQRDTRRASNYLRMITSDFVDGGVSLLEGDIAIPRGVLMGLMHEIDGRPAMAQKEWRAALDVVEKRLEKDASHAGWLYWKAWLQAAAGEAEAARATLQRRTAATRLSAAPQPAVDAPSIPIRRGLGGPNESAHVYLRCANPAPVLAGLEKEAAALRALRNRADLAAMLRNRMRFEPGWDPVRKDERFLTVLRDLETMAAAPDAR